MSAKLNSSALIREAIDAGITSPKEIAAWVKKTHRVEVKNSLIHHVKKQFATAGKSSKREEGTGSTTASSAPAKGRSRSELIREVLASGTDVPSEVVLWVKAKYGVDVTASLVGMVKHQWRKMATKTPNRDLHPSVTASQAAASKTAALAVEDIVAVKELVDRFGKENLTRLVEVL